MVFSFPRSLHVASGRGPEDHVSDTGNDQIRRTNSELGYMLECNLHILSLVVDSQLLMALTIDSVPLIDTMLPFSQSMLPFAS